MNSFSIRKVLLTISWTLYLFVVTSAIGITLYDAIDGLILNNTVGQRFISGVFTLGLAAMFMIVLNAAHFFVLGITQDIKKYARYLILALVLSAMPFLLETMNDVSIDKESLQLYLISIAGPIIIFVIKLIIHKIHGQKT